MVGRGQVVTRCPSWSSGQSWSSGHSLSIVVKWLVVVKWSVVVHRGQVVEKVTGAVVRLSVNDCVDDDKSVWAQRIFHLQLIHHQQIHHHYATLPSEAALCVSSVCVRPSVRPAVCPVPTVNSKTKNHTTFKLRFSHVISNWQNNKRLRLVVVGCVAQF